MRTAQPLRLPRPRRPGICRRAEAARDPRSYLESRLNDFQVDATLDLPIKKTEKSKVKKRFHLRSLSASLFPSSHESPLGALFFFTRKQKRKQKKKAKYDRERRKRIPPPQKKRKRSSPQSSSLGGALKCSRTTLFCFSVSDAGKSTVNVTWRSPRAPFLLAGLPFPFRCCCSS